MVKPSANDIQLVKATQANSKAHPTLTALLANKGSAHSKSMPVGTSGNLEMMHNGSDTPPWDKHSATPQGKRSATSGSVISSTSPRDKRPASQLDTSGSTSQGKRSASQLDATPQGKRSAASVTSTPPQDKCSANQLDATPQGKRSATSGSVTSSTSPRDKRPASQLDTSLKANAQLVSLMLPHRANAQLLQ